MNVLIRIPKGYIAKVNRNLYQANMTHSHMLGHKVNGSYIIIRSQDLEAVKKVFDKLALPCFPKFI